MLSGRAKLAGVIGWPVTYSLSPKLHNYWLTKYKIDGIYIPMSVDPESLKQAIKALPLLGFSGCNLTIPHKEAVVGMLDEVDDIAKSIGAVNTIIIKDGKLHGTNTDAYGFMENLKQQAALDSKKAVVLGAGGAARAVCKALLDEKFQQIVIANRTLAHAESLAGHFGKTFTAVSWDKRSQALEGATLLVNTTSLGLKDEESLTIDLSVLPREAVVSDTVYVPLITPLLKQARERGHTVVDGLGMLIHQAVPGFSAWFGRKPEITSELRHYLLGEHR
jgi:shikimate dehydrogenase